MVERSLDGRTFAYAARVAAHGTTALGHSYTSPDAAAPAALLYYRLRQVDLDGTATYSPVRSVSFSAAAAGSSVSLYPSVTRGAATLDLSQLPATATYQVLLTDMSGRTVRAWTLAGGQVQSLDVASAASGIYHVLLTGQQPDGSALRQTLRLTKE